MRHHLLLIALSGLTIAACKPTPRTAITPLKVSPPTVEESPAERPAPGLLNITSTRQDFNLTRPWEKQRANTNNFKGVYLGNRRVLTVGKAAESATYIELSLPDKTRTVPARVLKHDPSLNLALITVQHPEDASIFDSLTAHETGAPLALGSSAELWALVQGVTPVCTAVSVESTHENGLLPHIEMRASTPLPMDMANGLPILQDGRVVAIVNSHARDQQQLTCTNAELIARFLDEASGGNDVPVIGAAFTRLDDPAFRRYLKLAPEQGGIYVSKVLPGGAAQAAGVCEGDVITSVDDMPLDQLGRCKHPLYGLIPAPLVLRSIKPVGAQITLGISRNGEQLSIPVQLNRDAVDKALMPEEQPGVAPRYIMWGGLLFQPLTKTYLAELKRRANNSLPLALLELDDHLAEYMDEGRSELVGLTIVIPTPATLGYDSLGFCMVKAVNGKVVHSFDEMAELLDEPTEDGITELSLNRSPYTIYLDRQTVEASNDSIRRRIMPQLRRMEKK